MAAHMAIHLVKQKSRSIAAFLCFPGSDVCLMAQVDMRTGMTVAAPAKKIEARRGLV